MGLTHIDEGGKARMVDVSGKGVTLRRAVAEGFVVMKRATLEVLRAGTGPKGEVFGVARVAGILAAKRTGELIPLCHPLAVEQVTVDFAIEGTEARGHTGSEGGAEGEAAVRIEASATITARTGVEMEALMAVSMAGLTVIDMLKAIDKGMRLEGVRVVSKSGGRSGDVVK